MGAHQTECLSDCAAIHTAVLPLPGQEPPIRGFSIDQRPTDKLVQAIVHHIQHFCLGLARIPAQQFRARVGTTCEIWRQLCTRGELRHP